MIVPHRVQAARALAEARELAMARTRDGHRGEIAALLAAQVHATLELAEQQRAANLIAAARLGAGWADELGIADLINPG